MEKTLMSEMLNHDMARNVEAFTKSLMALCFLKASNEQSQTQKEEASLIKQAKNNVKVKNSAWTLASVEEWLRKENAHTKLIACERTPDMGEDYVFLYPSSNKNEMQKPFFVYVCIESSDSIANHRRFYETMESDNLENLKQCGFVVRNAKHAERSDLTLLESLQSLQSHVQLAHDSPLIPSNVPTAWLPPFCKNCRRIASASVVLYKMQCCHHAYCCSAGCWNEHLEKEHEKKEKLSNVNVKP